MVVSHYRAELWIPWDAVAPGEASGPEILGRIVMGTAGLGVRVTPFYRGACQGWSSPYLEVWIEGSDADLLRELAKPSQWMRPAAATRAAGEAQRTDARG